MDTQGKRLAYSQSCVLGDNLSEAGRAAWAGAGVLQRFSQGEQSWIHADETE
jgi:hypothetical protein